MESHQSHLVVELFCPVVDLPAAVDEIRQSIGRQRDELTQIARRGYAHHTSLNDEHPILPVA